MDIDTVMFLKPTINQSVTIDICYTVFCRNIMTDIQSGTNIQLRLQIAYSCHPTAFWEGRSFIDIDIFVNCNWGDTRWQYYSTHLHTNSTQNNTINNRTTKLTTYLGRARAMPRLCVLYPGICLTTEERARKNLSQGSWRVPAGTMKTEYTERKRTEHNNKNTQT